MKSEAPSFKPDSVVGYDHAIIPPDRAEDCPYLERWTVGVGLGRFWRPVQKGNPKAWFKIRLHHFYRSDEDDLHDHPWWFLTLVLKGYYEDWVDCPTCKGVGALVYERSKSPTIAIRCPNCGGRRQVCGTKMRPGTVRFRPANHRHRVVTDGVWTLVLSGPAVRDWGFWINGKWMRQRAYFRQYGGHAACDDIPTSR